MDLETLLSCTEYSRWTSLFGVRLAMLSLKCRTALRPTHLSASQKPCQVLATNQLLSLARLFGSAQHGAGLDFKGSLGKVGK